MKKRLFAMLLSALLLANVSACRYVPQSEIEEPFENNDTIKSNFEETDEKPTENDTTESKFEETDEKLTENDTTESNFEETDEKITESETNAEIKPPQKSLTFYNGVWGNSNATYTFHQNGEISLHIADWNEDHLVTSLSDKDMNASKYYPEAIAVNNECAFLLLTRYYENKIKVVSFEKGSTSETVVNLDVDEDVYEISGNFINENTGYIFTFKEVLEGHAVGGSKLSNLFKTEDGGRTWTSINVQNVPSISLRNYIRFAKMISEDVGIISGNIFAADYDFCERTLLTTDGGLNWVHVNIPEMPEEDDLEWAEVSDFTQVDGSYILTIRYGIAEGIDDDAKYKLLGLNTWIRIN